MTVTTSGHVTVPSADLIAALAAVLPHAAPNLGTRGGDVGVQHRVRLRFDTNRVYVLACNGSTVALADVEYEDSPAGFLGDEDDGAFVLDLLPLHVRRILGSFKVKRRPAADDPTPLTQLTFDAATGAGELAVRDVNGLFPGQEFTVPALATHAQFPDLQASVARALREAAGAAAEPRELAAHGDTLALFKAASTAYGKRLKFTGTGPQDGRSFLVSAGDSFLGILLGKPIDDTEVKREDAIRRRWLEQLGPLPTDVPLVPPAEQKPAKGRHTPPAVEPPIPGQVDIDDELDGEGDA